MTARPFLRWAGGKTQLLPELLKRIPKTFRAYHEPFVGAGALFFALQPKHAYLGDANLRLIRSYRGVQRDVDTTIKYLRDYYTVNHSEQFYYAARAANVDGCANDADVAAWFIYLNKTCYNGLYRVNSSGGFNTPLDKSKKPSVVLDEENLRACHTLLSQPEIYVNYEDFRTGAIEGRVYSDDVVYFDPPYVPMSDTSDFTAYTAAGFRPIDQEALRDLALKMKDHGTCVILSNSSNESVGRLYDSKHFTIDTVPARRSVNSKVGKRGPVSEYIIT